MCRRLRQGRGHRSQGPRKRPQVSRTESIGRRTSGEAVKVVGSNPALKVAAVGSFGSLILCCGSHSDYICIDTVKTQMPSSGGKSSINDIVITFAFTPATR